MTIQEKAIEQLENLATIGEKDVAIQALENENVIDKIRAEIEAKEMIEENTETMFYNMALKDCLNILDKYKAESEDME